LIRRPRALVAQPPSLADANSPAAAERLKAERYYLARRPPRENMTFEVYGRDDVKLALNQLFGDKCAYCEFDFSPGMPVDVEHYRPKGGVVDGHGQLLFPGYWWLASEWSNLLPSCIDCNRARWHRFGVDRYKFGKENLFPLPPGQGPARNQRQVAAECPLLINPADDDPAQHLRHVYKRSPKGRMESLVEPVLVNGVEDPRGVASRDTYGLNRPSLARARRKRLEDLKLALDGVEVLYEVADQEPDPLRRAAYRARGRATARRVIAQYLHWSSEFAATCRAYYREWLMAFNERRAAP
jgi:uncharacterized protein (TIGR02646 family)